MAGVFRCQSRPNVGVWSTLIMFIDMKMQYRREVDEDITSRDPIEEKKMRLMKPIDVEVLLLLCKASVKQLKQGNQQKNASNIRNLPCFKIYHTSELRS